MLFKCYGGYRLSHTKDLKAEESRQNFRKYVNKKAKKRGKRH